MIPCQFFIYIVSHYPRIHAWKFEFTVDAPSILLFIYNLYGREPDLQIYSIAQWLDESLKGEGNSLKKEAPLFILAGTKI